MPRNFKKAFITIGVILFIGFIVAFSSQYIPAEIQVYINYLFLGIILIGGGYFISIWWVEYNRQLDQIAKTEDKITEASNQNSTNFGYSIPMFKTKTFQKYFLPVILIALGVSVFQTYQTISSQEDKSMVYIYIGLASIGLVFTLVYILFWRFRFAITKTELILSYSTLMGGRKYSPVKLSKIKEHFIESQIREDLSALVIRTNMPPWGERAFNPILQFIFTPPLYNDPNIFIPIRSKADADEILKRLK